MRLSSMRTLFVGVMARIVQVRIQDYLRCRGMVAPMQECENMNMFAWDKVAPWVFSESVSWCLTDQ